MAFPRIFMENRLRGDSDYADIPHGTHRRNISLMENALTSQSLPSERSCAEFEAEPQSL